MLLNWFKLSSITSESSPRSERDTVVSENEGFTKSDNEQFWFVSEFDLPMMH